MPRLYAAMDRVAVAGDDAEAELTRRTGRAFFPAWLPGDARMAALGKPRLPDPARHVTEEELLRVAPDLAEALNVFR